MPRNQHELKRRARHGTLAAAERAARNAGQGARPKARRRARFAREVIQPMKDRLRRG